MLAEELQGRLYRIGVPAYAWSEVHSGLTSAAIQDSDTVALGISTTGRTEETIEMLAEAGRAGAFTVAITNNPTSPLAELADRSIVTSIYEQFRTAGRPVGQAWPAPRAGPALPAGRPAELRPIQRQAGRVRLGPSPRIADPVARRPRRRPLARLRDAMASASAQPRPSTGSGASRGRRSAGDEERRCPRGDRFRERGESETRAPGQLWPPTADWTRRSV